MSGIRQFFSRNLVKLTPCFRPPRIYPKSDKAKLKLPFNGLTMNFLLRQAHGHHQCMHGQGVLAMGSPVIKDLANRVLRACTVRQRTLLWDRNRDFLLLEQRRWAIVWTIIFLFAEPNFACVSTGISIQFSTRSFPEPKRMFGLLNLYNAPLAIRYPPDIRPRPLPGLIFSNIRPRSVTNWISTCGLNRFATCSLRSAECHRVKPTANLVCVISEVTGAQFVTAAQHTLRRVGSL